MTRSILVTGCSTGIGYHCALALKEEGWRVFATARRTEDLQSLQAQGLEAVTLDYSDQSSIDACIRTVLEKTGGQLDALFNNGAFGQPGAVEDLPIDILRAQFEANFFGWHELTRQIIPVMRSQGHGRIVQCSSVLGFIPMAFRGAYIASKYALEGLTDTMRLELHGSGIHISLIDPGPITSRFRENARVKFIDNIDIENSPFAERYKKRLSKLESDLPDTFELPPEAVLKKLHHALNASSPKPRYFVTFPTYLMAILKRILPTRILDAFLRANGD